MAVLIGHASIDENGKIKDGRAGDQTTKEVCIREWYSKPWDFVLRCKDPVKAEKMAVACEQGCANDNIGYDQNQRNTLNTQAKTINYDLSKISVSCETDCSAFMAVCAQAAGIDIPYTSNNAPTTSTMGNVFISTGNFRGLTDPIYLTNDSYLRRGDILVKRGSHTAMVLQNGAKALPVSVGIDVSSYQKNIDWYKAKNDGIEFAILKIIRKDLNPDNQFENNWKGCINARIPIYGVYNYSYAASPEKAKIDAQKVIEILGDRKTAVWLDVEDDCQKNLGAKLIDIINAYAAVIMGANLGFGVYTGENFYKTYIKPYNMPQYPLWIARYGKNNGKADAQYEPKVNNMCGWQYTSKGQIDGVSGDVDMDIFYIGTANIPQKEEYYKKPQFTLKESLDKIGVDSSFENRQKIAAINNIENYTGTSEQNLYMLNLLNQGKLRKS